MKAALLTSFVSVAVLEAAAETAAMATARPPGERLLRDLPLRRRHQFVSVAKEHGLPRPPLAIVSHHLHV